MARRQDRAWNDWYSEFEVVLRLEAGYKSLTDMAVFDHVSSTDDVVLQVEDALRTMWESGMSPEEAIIEIEDTFFSEKYNIDLDGDDEEYSGEDADDLDQRRDDLVDDGSTDYDEEDPEPGDDEFGEEEIDYDEDQQRRDRASIATYLGVKKRGSVPQSSR